MSIRTYKVIFTSPTIETKAVTLCDTCKKSFLSSAIVQGSIPSDSISCQICGEKTSLIPEELKQKIISALAWFGEPAEKISDVDICENGDVYLGLTKIIEG